jgi:hypothetical protein
VQWDRRRKESNVWEADELAMKDDNVVRCHDRYTGKSDKIFSQKKQALRTVDQRFVSMLVVELC